MGKQAISVTLDADNITWLRGRVGATGLRSVSELLDQIVRTARQSGRIGPAVSVVGTVETDPDDPLLTHADAMVRAVFDKALGRPLMVKETPPRYRARARGTHRRG